MVELVAEVGSAAAVADSDGLLLLHHAVLHRRSPDVVRAVLEADPHAAAVADSQSRLAFVMALKQEPAWPDDVLTLMVSAEGAAVADSDGRLMLHHAAQHCRSAMLLQAVYDASPKAAAALDGSSQLPLVIGLERSSPLSDEEAMVD